MRHAWDYVWSPIAFFEGRLEHRPGWGLAVGAPAACGVLQLLASAALVGVWEDVQAEVVRSLGGAAGAAPPPALMIVAGAMSHLMTYAMALLALLAMNVLYADAAAPGRLAEFTGLCFLTQIPFLVCLIVMMLLVDPPPFRIPASAASIDVLHAVRAYRDRLFEMPALSTSRILSYYSTFWLATQLACALKAAGRLTARAAVVAGLFLVVLFLGAELVIGR